MALLAETLVVLHTYEEMCWEPEVYRLKGELLLRQALSAEQEAEACFYQALDVARQQRTEASALLAPIYDRFTEGFDTADLQEARTLLEELRENPSWPLKKCWTRPSPFGIDTPA